MLRLSHNRSNSIDSLHPSPYQMSRHTMSYYRLILCLCLALGLLQCSPATQVDMSFNRQTFVQD